MKVLLVLAAAVAVAYAGVGVLTPNIAQEAARLYQKFCSGASERGREGSTFVYCKHSKDGGEADLTHDVKLKPKPDAPSQVVFVKPPSKKYNHKVVITGQQGGKQQATIYVLPQKDEHSVEVVDKTEKGGEPVKPQLFFLNDNPADGTPSKSSKDSTAYLPPSSKKRPLDTYLPPKTKAPTTSAATGYSDAAESSVEYEDVEE